MGKLLAIAGVALVALLVLLWYQIRSPAEAATAAPKPLTPAQQIAAVTPAPSTLAKSVAAAAEASDKIDPASDEFFNKFDDLQPHKLLHEAAKCYTGGLHRTGRDAKLKLEFTNHIENGDVTVRGVKVVEDTIHDPELTNCFIREVTQAKWHEDRLPNYDAPDMLLIRPERGMKKYWKENMDYEGDGPDFTTAHPIAASSATK